MNDVEGGTPSLLFQLHRSSGIFAIPIQYAAWVEALEERAIPMPQSPDHVAGVYQLHGKSIGIIDLGQLLGFGRLPARPSSKQCLIILANAQAGFLVDKVLGVELLCSPQSAGPLSAPFTHSVYSCARVNGMVLELDVPGLLARANAHMA